MRKVVSLLVFATLLAGAFSLAYAVPAFADLKAVVTIICNAYTDTVVLVSMSSNSKKTFPVASDTFCTNFMVSMDALGWHVSTTCAPEVRGLIRGPFRTRAPGVVATN